MVLYIQGIPYLKTNPDKKNQCRSSIYDLLPPVTLTNIVLEVSPSDPSKYAHIKKAQSMKRDPTLDDGKRSTLAI